MNAALVLLGGALLKIVLTGAYLRYVRPGLAGWLLTAGTAIILLAASGLAREIRAHEHGCDTRKGAHGPGREVGEDAHGHEAVREARHEHADGDGHEDGHRHGRWSRWLLLVPVLVLFLAAPPALGADSVVRSSGRGAPAPNQRFGPLPPSGVVPLGLSEFVARSVWDTTGSLRGRTIRLTGFVVHEHGSSYLARLVITCCAADATPMTVRLDGASANALPDNQWITVQGTPEPGSATQSNGYTVALDATTLTPTTPPSNPYEY